jgi:choline monooxygenase
MFINTTRLPHLLTPDRYYDKSAYQQELEHVLSNSWHFVGSTAELSKPGDFITLTICNKAIQIRNFDGQIKALSNVCAHRHALICSAKFGNSPTMRCQYHGWEYQKDGQTGRIPEPKNFVPFESANPCLPQYAVETVGQLVFVNLANAPQPLEQFLGLDFHALLAERFGSEWTMALSFEPHYPVNWKIPIENSLEAYHVPSVHPNTFRDDPGESRSEHVLLSNRTAFGSHLPFSPHNRFDNLFQSLECRFVKWLGYSSTKQYWQHHVFPNLLFSFTDAISLCNCVVPTSELQCYAKVRQFGRLPKNGGWLKRAMARGWSGVTAAITKRILIEDLKLFPAIQAGMESSPHTGVLGRCEERIHQFQSFLQDAIPTRSDIELPLVTRRVSEAQ